LSTQEENVNIDKGNFPHFLIKEIYEQPAAVRDTVLAQLHRDGSGLVSGVPLSRKSVERLSKINIVASGTSRHAGLAGRTMIHELAHVPVEVDYASEFENRNVPGLGELTIIITQSGETADTLSALRKAKEQGSRTLAITNVPGSTMAREADAALYTHAGPEISIASTKAFTTQLAALYLIAVFLGETRGALDPTAARGCIDELLAIPEKLTAVLERDAQCRELARMFHGVDDFMFLGRGIHYAIAMEGALKLKETSYIHAEGYPAGEIKHGPYALVDEHLVVVALATKDPHDAASLLRWEKTLADIREIKQHGARVIALALESDLAVSKVADATLLIPPAPELLLPLVEIVPLQLLAYHIAVARGCNVDQPRNLVKAVVS
jgi:glucosamine--fructose-6-phosphate aminotransferase (isomerizing)